MKTKESNSLFSGVLLPVNLLMRILVFLLPAVLLCGCSSSDDGSGDGGNPVPEYDRLLVGTWQISDNGGDQSAPGTLVLEADGKGTYDDGTLKWYTSERKLYVSFDNGRRIKGDFYYVDGAELTIQGSNLVYTTSFPAVGRWYAEDFKGGFFSFDFRDIGTCKIYGFDDGGNQAKDGKARGLSGHGWVLLNRFFLYYSTVVFENKVLSDNAGQQVDFWGREHL